MPKKSRREKILQSKRKQIRGQQTTAPVPQQVAPAQKPAAPPPQEIAATKSTPKTVRYPFVTAELRRIGMLAGIILVILIILAVVL